MSHARSIPRLRRPADLEPSAEAAPAPPPPVVWPSDQPPARSAHGPPPGEGRFWQRLAFAAVLVLSAVLNLYGLDRLGYSNQYYAAAVYSMLQSWHNLFFLSFDPTGLVSLDKPPLGFWIQAASARLLGFSGLSLLLPQALAGVASVALLYHLVRRAFGPLAGLLAGLALALMPVSVAVSRNNTVDSLLVLTLLLAVWAGLLAAERQRLRWLLLAAALLGLGFEIKMLQAYLALPAVFLLYLLAARSTLRTRLAHLTLASLVLLVVSFAWPVAVDLTPPSQRPFVDSTETNSAIRLVFGYNGIARLLGRTLAARQADGSPSTGSPSTTAPVAAGAGQAVAAPLGGPGGFAENGEPGPLRLLNSHLAGQASWLLPLALAGLAFTAPLLWTRRRSLGRSRAAQACLLWGTWLACTAGVLSVAEFFHRYYLVMLGPPVAALAAIGLWGGWRAYRRAYRRACRRGRPLWLLPLSLLACGAVQAGMLADYPAYASWLTPIVLGGPVTAALVLLALRRPSPTLAGPTQPTSTGAAATLAAGLGTLALLAAPAVWSIYTTLTPGDSRLVAAGPPPPNLGPGLVGRDETGLGRGSSIPELTAFLEANRGNATYLAATSTSGTAAPIMLASGQPVMSLGGFLGNSPILTVDELATRIQAGEVRFFLVGGIPPGQDGTDANAWVQATCAPASAPGLAQGAVHLYDCGALRGVPG